MEERKKAGVRAALTFSLEVVLFKKNSSPEDICFDFRETEREKEREASMAEMPYLP